MSRRGVGETLDNASISLEGGLGATPWVDRLLTEHWDAIEAVAATSETGSTMPQLHPQRGRSKKLSAVEYGCGHYGCVMPTGDENIVCKVTSDESEAFFVACALKIGEMPPGIVNYTDIRAFPKSSTHRGRSTFILWREAAHDVGITDRRYWGLPAPTGRGDSYEAKNAEELYRLIRTFRDAASGVRQSVSGAKSAEATATLHEKADALSDWAWDHVSEGGWNDVYDSRASEPFKSAARGMDAARRYAFGLRICRTTIEYLENTFRGDSLGGALEFYLDHGLLLCDVHAQNIGRVHRAEGSDGGEEPIVITDPGHALALDARWSEVRIEEL